ncbi:GNAT family N-acetyltransferase [Undibacterium sp. Jales W-56]|uniref:GNAT family N-acetyltransferase n=1 Tax=Undibacterium sp. Jales W-56 TaxID=2897325 RepID=UPI0021D32DC2|nr:GNAT family N-acetyltransferase [Undibacterium sp. Jales W-56]MCU6432429.1 GNAT family N-acetyltransferase [Undibacterium sp. Jales W-56]
MNTIINADLHHPQHAQDLLMLLNAYASDRMGGSDPLSAFARANLIPELQKRSNVHAVLAYVDGQAAGFSICFEGFSTFACQPLLNIHDLGVLDEFRGLGLSKLILNHIEQLAREHGCCKMTLEVLEGNHLAKGIYQSLGFAGYELDPAMGGAIMMQKKLAASANSDDKLK